MLEKGFTYGVVYNQKYCSISNQIYSRCEYFEKKNPFTKKAGCRAQIYSKFIEDSVYVVNIVDVHNHQLMTQEEILQKITNSRKSIPKSIKVEAYNLYIKGESICDIYRLLTKRDFPEGNIPYTFGALQSFVHDKNKKEAVSYTNSRDLYEALLKNINHFEGVKIEVQKEDENVLSCFAVTFEEQIKKCKYIVFIFNINRS